MKLSVSGEETGLVPCCWPRKMQCAISSTAPLCHVSSFKRKGNCSNCLPPTLPCSSVRTAHEQRLAAHGRMQCISWNQPARWRNRLSHAVDRRPAKFNLALPDPEPFLFHHHSTIRTAPANLHTSPVLNHALENHGMWTTGRL